MYSIKQLYQQREYKEIIQILNPSMNPDHHIPEKLVYYYIWSLVRFHLFDYSFPRRTDRNTIISITKLIEKYILPGHQLFEIIKEKTEIFNQYISKRTCSDQNDDDWNEDAGDEFEEQSEYESQYDREYNDYSLGSYGTSREYEDYGFDNQTAIEQGNWKFYQ